MRVVVTGGGGFLGKAILKHLKDGGHDAVCFSRGDYPDLRGAGIRTVRGDICDRASVRRALDGADAVVHTAAKVGFWGEYSEFHRINVDGTRNMLEACRELGIRDFVHTSSPSVVFDGRDMEGVDESVPYPKHHGSHYNATKTIAERMVLSANSEELRTVALRPHLIWGPGDEKLVPGLIKAARENRLPIIGDGKNVVDTVYVDNAAMAHLLALKALSRNKACRGRPYFISNGEPTNVWEIINRFLGIAGIPPVKRKVPVWAAMIGAWIAETKHRMTRAPGDPPITRFLVSEISTSHWFDISAARMDIGYDPSITIDEGMRRYAEWLGKEPDTLSGTS